MKRVVIAIDGPAGAGKSTISKLVASKLNLKYIDTGAMYRAVTLKTIKYAVNIEDCEALNKMLDKTDVYLEDGNKVILDGVDVSEEIRMPYVTERVSAVSAIPAVRKRLVDIQRRMADNESVIMDGRDIGSNVLPGANNKIFLTASVEERAMRRHKELINKGIDISFEKVCDDIIERDKLDTTREVNPLVQARDAFLFDTTGLTINEVVQGIIDYVKDKE